MDRFRFRLAATSTALVLTSLWLFAQPPTQAPAAPQGAPAVGQGGPGRGQGRGGRGPRVRKTLLIWADTRNGRRSTTRCRTRMSVIERLGYESGAYDSYIRTDSNIISKSPLQTTGNPASGGPSLSNVDAIFFLGHREVPLDDKQKADLLSFVRDDGKGFVAAHTATTAFLGWPEFGELIGARYDGHPWGTAAGTIINEDPSFPATRHFGPAPFAFTDEFYQAKETRARSCTYCSGSTCRRCRRAATCTGPMETSRSYGPRTTERAASSTPRSAMRPPPGTTATWNRCTSKPSSGRSA